MLQWLNGERGKEDLLLSGGETQYVTLELKWGEEGVTERCVHVCKFKMYSCVCAPQHCPLKRSGGSDIPIITSTTHPQIMASKYQFPLKGGKMIDSRAEARKVQDEFEKFCVSKSKEILKKCWQHIKRTQEPT